MSKKNNFLDKFNHKIISALQLKKKIGLFPRKKKTIMCHGNFDVVHPGHIRHLVFAKSKADILVVSITSDSKISKGIYRPHVPEKLRAFNLAALEIVDYVIIDHNRTPNKNISIIKPDFFAKGFEYSKKIPDETLQEKNIVEKYGGEMIFSPGDIVYSSTKIINDQEPDIKTEKILSIFHEHNIDFKKIKDVINSKKKFKVHIIGDLIIDKFTNTNIISHQSKTPTPSVLFNNEIKYVGGAGIVALHLKKCGMETTFSSITGDDENSKFAETFLKSNHVKVNFLKDKNTVTTEKNVVIANNYRMIKIDKVDNTPISLNAINYLKEKIKSINADAIIFSDFRHGIFNKYSINDLSSVLRKIKNVIKIADSQVASRWGNICDFQNFDLITPNEKEARFSLGDQDSSISNLTRQLFKKSKCKYLILKLGSRGSFVVDNTKKSNTFSFPSLTNNLIDPVGAGDALLAYSTYGLLASKSIVQASIMGSLAAACACESDGNIPLDKKIILKKIENFEKNLR
ncbi:PfkB family carbohydrate kinase [Candidatus Pelagibacter sp.]|nr:PfkB family carbohydrate kinase [Candidatus Pelagibacter sp.]